MITPHRSRRPTSSDSGYSTTSERSHSPTPEKTRSSRQQAQRGTGQEPAHTPNQQSHSLLSIANHTDLQRSIGTTLNGIQLSALTSPQWDDLARLVSERGVVFLRNQEISPEQQLEISKRLGASSSGDIIAKSAGSLTVKSGPSDFGEKFVSASDWQNDWVSDRSFEEYPPSYSIFKAEESGGNSAWISQYALYDGLSKPVKRFVDSLEAIHTSQFQFSSIKSLRGMPSDRAPESTQHPAVLTHPVTGLKALNVTPGAVAHFADLTTHESQKVLELLLSQISSSDQHVVRLTWEADDVAIWDNRSTAFKFVPGWNGDVKGTWTSSAGEKPLFDPQSESVSERATRIAREEELEEIKQREIKARYNDTPLRRILRRQADGEDPNTTTSKFHDENVKSYDGLSQESSPIVQQTAEEKKEASTVELSTPLTTKVVVNSRGSPLRRIIQRQASGSLNARW